MSKAPFTSEEERFIAQQLGSSDNRQVQRSLQFLCEQSRRGRFFTDVDRIRPVIVNCLYRPSLGVKRWALNALVEFGIGRFREIVFAQLTTFLDEPDLYASLIRLLFAAEREDKALLLLSKHGLPVHGLALIAGAEHSHTLRRRLVRERIPLEHSLDEELRAAIVLTGKHKAPPHIFLRNHSNEIALGELSLHDTDSVAKYALWAQAERRLGFSALRRSMSDYDASAPQVRKWILRLLFSDAPALAENLDLIKHAERDGSEEVREEAAIQLRNTYVPAASTEVRSWFLNEPHEPTRMAILDHMAAYAFRDSAYHDIVMQMYKDAPMKSAVRERLEASSSGTALFRKLRAIELEEESLSLFSNDNDRGLAPVVNIHQTFNAPVGAATGQGHISASTIAAVNQVQSPELKSALSKALQLVEQVPDPVVQEEGKAAIEEAAKNPSRSALGRIIDWAGKAQRAADSVTGFVSSADGLIETLQNIDMPG